MELGAVICTAKSPLCDTCPIADDCAFLKAGRPGLGERRTRPRQRFQGTDRQVRGLVPVSYTHLGDWIPMATARMNRPITAGPGATAKGNPLAARKPGDPYQDGEVPDTDYNVVVFENRFPSMVRVPGVSEDVTYVDGNPLWEKKLAAGRCEVICFDPNEDGLPADLPVSRLRTVVEAWAFRTAEISKMEGIEQIFPFENHGQEIGVSLAHPHGQVYCYPFIAPKMEKELQHTEAYHEKTGGNLLKDIMNAELEAGERIVMRNHSWVAYVPAAARWPLEVHVLSLIHI